MSTHSLRAARPATGASQQLDALLAALGDIIVGKPQALRLAVTCLLARGHLLIEDLPGVGKTTLAYALARSIGLDFRRVQFTSDLLPADVLGVSVLNRDTGRFEFHPGPVFSELLLADEINRATPKAQSALLEAMEERQVSVDGATYPLPAAFFVIGTQNPSHQLGTFPLPESQLDRFLMQIELGYPAPENERALYAGTDRRTLVEHLEPVMTADALLRLQTLVTAVHVAEPLLDYVQALVAHTRHRGDFVTGLSPRAGIALVRAARAHALLNGRAGVHPDDVQAVFPSIAAHRLAPAPGVTESRAKLHAAVLAAVPIP